jgi:hypothetical protein
MASITYDEAAHLLRRMGFGGPPDEINALVALGREGAVDQLINYDRIDNSEMEKALPALVPLYKINSSTFMRHWWFLRMALTKRPFEEKLTMFWHHHFATSEIKTFFLQIFYQNLTLRTYALARFDDLLLQVAQDAAMLFWLDGFNSIKGNANENFARELQELFTLGITDVVTGEVNYSEQDVKEIARAFTGWSCVIPNPKKLKPNKPSKYLFQIKGNDHDDGGKPIYGQEQGIALYCTFKAYLDRCCLLYQQLFSITTSGRNSRTSGSRSFQMPSITALNSQCPNQVRKQTQK